MLTSYETKAFETSFWSKSDRSRSRFNLLLLEYGEYFFDDFSCNYHDSSSKKPVPGRLKLCSRSLLFEPSDPRRPLIKYPFRYFDCELALKEGGGKASTFMTFDTICYFEMKENFTIKPYHQVGRANLVASQSAYNSSSLSGGEGNKRYSETSDVDLIEVMFSFVFTENQIVYNKISNLQCLYHSSERKGVGAHDELLKPMLGNILSSNLFDSSQLIDYHEEFLLPQPIKVRKVQPLIQNPGLLMITNERLYFQLSQVNNVGEPMSIIPLNSIENVFKRRFLLRQIGIEIFFNKMNAFFAFDTHEERNFVFDILSQNILQSNSNVGGNANKNAANKIKKIFGIEYKSLQDLQARWQAKQISNFDYLMILNLEADRSVNDLTQYPVFPHVITDYVSSTLDFENPAIYRDLTKPVGALNPKRLDYFRERMESMAPHFDDESPSSSPVEGRSSASSPRKASGKGAKTQSPHSKTQGGGADLKQFPPPFLYGTHYSTPGYVLYYLVRVAPEYMLCLQNGKFDATDRMFHSMKDTWESCLTNPTDLKELIPEFFIGNGSFLLNNDNLPLGTRHDGKNLHHVELPPWANNDPKTFISIMRDALESEYVSNHLHHWIDLIFGYKQKGAEAIEYDNLFYYLTYEGSIDLESVVDIKQRAALEMQIQEFGQTPKQLFTNPHESRGGQRNGVSNLRQRDFGENRNRVKGKNANVKGGDERHEGNSEDEDENDVDDRGDDYPAAIEHLGDDFHNDVMRLVAEEEERQREKESGRQEIDFNIETAGSSDKDNDRDSTSWGSIWSGLKVRTASLIGDVYGRDVASEYFPDSVKSLPQEEEASTLSRAYQAEQSYASSKRVSSSAMGEMDK